MKRTKKDFILYAGLLAMACIGLPSCTEKKEYTEEEAWTRIGRFRSENQADSMELALEYYLDNYPDGKYATEAGNLQDLFNQEKKQWLDILQHNCSIEAVDRFIFNHPDGFFHTQAVNAIDSLTFRAAEAEHTTEALQAYVDEYPEGRFLPQAHALLNKLELGDMSAEEKETVTQTLRNHFHYLTINSDEIESTVAPVLSSYMGKSQSTSDDVMTYMQHVHADGKMKLIEPHDINIKKIESKSGSLYNATFRLVEVVNPEDSINRQSKSFKGTAVLNSYGEITSVVLE